MSSHLIFLPRTLIFWEALWVFTHSRWSAGNKSGDLSILFPELETDFSHQQEDLGRFAEHFVIWKPNLGLWEIMRESARPIVLKSPFEPFFSAQFCGMKSVHTAVQPSSLFISWSFSSSWTETPDPLNNSPSAGCFSSLWFEEPGHLV